MNRLFLLAALMAASPLHAKLRVVATLPDLADIARRVGGTRVNVDSLAKGTEDIHAIPQRPSFLPRLNQADALVLLGLGAEHAFLPALLEVAQNPRILPGQVGEIDCSQNITPKDVPQTITRAEGEQHPQGNPHYNLDPRNGAAIADAIASGLTRIDPAGAEMYKSNAEKFKSELAEKIIDWKKRSAALKGIKAVSHHKDMVYLADFVGLSLVGEVEPKPGIAPTPKHLQELVAIIKAQGVRVIIREVHFPPQTSEWLATQTGARIAVVPVMAGAFPDAGDYLTMIEHSINALLQAAK